MAVIAPSNRRVDLDVVRAVALIGVAVMNYHGYLILRGAPQGDGLVHRIFDPWTGPLSTRFAATFVVVAGMGSTLLVARVRRYGTDIDRARARLVLAMRGVLLFVGGYFLDQIWPGTILWFYGLYFVVGAFLVFARARWIIVVAAMAVLGALAVNCRRIAEPGWLPGAAERTNLRGGLLWSLVDGTHPLLPWLAFYLAGVLLGRAWSTVDHRRLVAVASGMVVLAVVVQAIGQAVAPDGRFTDALVSLESFSRSPMYVMETLGVAVLAIVLIGGLAERTAGSAITTALAATGRTTLTLYVAHVLVFNLLVDWLEWVRPTGLDVALAFALGFWVVGVAVAVLLQRTIGTGPVEWIYRRLSGPMPRPGPGLPPPVS